MRAGQGDEAGLVPCHQQYRGERQDLDMLYGKRWSIELFCRWIKQTLKITRFLGTSDNAIRIQVAVALIAFLLLRMAQKLQTVARSPLAFARLVKLNVMRPRRFDQLDRSPSKALECPGQGLLCLPTNQYNLARNMDQYLAGQPWSGPGHDGWAVLIVGSSGKSILSRPGITRVVIQSSSRLSSCTT